MLHRRLLAPALAVVLAVTGALALGGSVQPAGAAVDVAESYAAPAAAPSTTDLLRGTYTARQGRLSGTRKPKIINVKRPQIVGTPSVRGTVKATPGRWNPKNVTVRYHWYLGSQQLKSTNRVLAVRPSWVGKRLQVSVVAVKRGYQKATVASRRSAKVSLPSLAPSAPLGLIGRPTVGRTLKVRLGSWGAKGVSFSITWKSNRATVGTGKRYRLAPSDRGHRVRAVVKAAKRGYDSGRASTPSVRVS
ncbi:MAG: hypothetical protein CMH83_04335 [Nocardioides sp.]|nr:hypothetical protein [Nocardioides sp.]